MGRVHFDSTELTKEHDGEIVITMDSHNTGAEAHIGFMQVRVVYCFCYIHLCNLRVIFF
jgi:hypothetical protein